MLPNVTMEGRLVANPELQFLPSGAALCKFRVAANDRKRNAQTGQYEDGDPIFLSVTCWRNMAENVAETVQQGDLVVITGRLKQRDYEVEGQRRTSYEIDADDIGVSLRFGSARLNRTQRQGQPQQGQYQGQGQDDPWAQAAQQGRANATVGQNVRQQAPQPPQQAQQQVQQGWQQTPYVDPGQQPSYGEPPF